jgi:hypothetical protein
METIGYSTGSLARSDVRGALHLLESLDVGALELSALRAHELGPLLEVISELLLDRYHNISVHAPSAFSAAEEPGIAAALLPVARRGWVVVIHPDTIHDHYLWTPFGDRLAIENMDRRKPVGRTTDELRPVFRRLPEASFCLDLAHAWQCDPTMLEAARMLAAFGERLAEVHMSQLDADSRHVRLTQAGIGAYQRFAELIPVDVPVIIEAPVRPEEIESELEASLVALGRLVPCCA